MAARKLALFRIGHEKSKADNEWVLEYGKYRHSYVSKTSKSGCKWHFAIYKAPDAILTVSLLVSIIALGKEYLLVVLAHPFWEVLRRSLGA